MKLTRGIIKMKKRVLSAVLAVLIVLSIIPVSAFAAESESLKRDGSELKRAEWLKYLSNKKDDSLQQEGEASFSKNNIIFMNTPPAALSISGQVYETSNSVSGQVYETSNSVSGQVFATSNSVKRYTVLVLDVSGSMYGTPIAALRTAASNFCQQVLEADGENYVAIVTYHDYAEVRCEFTNTLSVLQTAIDGLTDLWSTNITSGLQSADTLLSAIPNDANTIKNVLLLSDGLPNLGEYSNSGPYSYSDYYYYEYANATYYKAADLKNKGYYLYTLGFFHNLLSNELFFARSFMNDLQNAGYYEVVNPNDLDFVFGDIANNIVRKSGTFKYPGTFPSGTDAKDKFDVSSTYNYDDYYFLEDAKTYNSHLATMSLCFELSAWSSYDADSKKLGWSADTATKNVRELLTGDDGIGFEQFEYNSFWSSPPTKNSIGAVAANKKIVDSSNNEYTLIALAVRGGGYYSEWSSNFSLGTSGQHEGFSTAKENVLTFLSQYITDKGITGNIKLWIVGYSRAGATANLVAGALNSGRTLPNVTLAQKDLYAYTFEAPQGALISQVIGDHTNIHNIININDVVPLVAPSVWDFNFVRYNGSSYPLPSIFQYGFNSKKSDMLTEYFKLAGTNKIDYKIDEYTRKFEVQVDPLRILPGGDPFVKLVVVADKDYPQSKLLIDTVNSLCGDSIGSRAKYVSDMQTGIEEIMDLSNSYYNEKKEWINRVFSEFTLSEIEYIISPIYSINPFYLNSDRIKDIGDRLIETFTKHCQELGISVSQSFVNSTLRVLADYIFSHPIHFAKLVDNIRRDSVLQGHIPEVCLAWLRSQDSYYKAGASFGASPGTYRLIRINCPVDVDVYDSNNKLVASIVDDVPQEVDSGIISIINENGEKIIYFPADEEFSIDIKATAEGKMTYSVNELSIISGDVKRAVNYYEVPMTSGETFTGIVPVFTSDELESNIPEGSSVAYQLLNKSNVQIPASEDIKGASVEANFYDVIVVADNNSGYVQGSGSFLKGTFAKVKAIPQSGSSFLGWYKNDELMSTETEYRFAVTENTTLIAKFVPVERHNLKLIAGTGGRVTSIEGTYTVGTQIAVVAEANNGYKFKEWTATQGAFDSATSSSAWFTMPESDTIVTANFEYVGSSGDGGGGGGGGASTAFTITTGSLPNGIVGKPYSTAISTSGGSSPYTWSASGLPGGLEINASSGIISGAPAKEGKYAVSVSVKDNKGHQASKNFDLTVNIENQSLEVVEVPVDQTSTPPNILKDITGHWAEKNIERLVELGAVIGYPDGTIKPDKTITRAEFATILVKAFKLEPRQGNIFNDILNHWAKDSISTAAAYGIVEGYDENTFGPDDLITREQMAAMSIRAAKLSKVSGELTFVDSMDISAWARDDVITAVTDGIISGYPDNTFRPANNATRAEAFTVIANALK